MTRTSPPGTPASWAPDPLEGPVRSFHQDRPDGPGLAVQVHRTGPDSAALALTGPLDCAGVRLLAQVLDRHRHVHAQRSTHLDLTGVTRIDTAGLSALIRLPHQYTARNRQLILSATHPSYTRLSTLTWLNQVLTLDDPTARARQSAAQPAPARRLAHH